MSASNLECITDKQYEKLQSDFEGHTSFRSVTTAFNVYVSMKNCAEKRGFYEIPGGWWSTYVVLWTSKPGHPITVTNTWWKVEVVAGGYKVHSETPAPETTHPTPPHGPPPPYSQESDVLSTSTGLLAPESFEYDDDTALSAGFTSITSIRATLDGSLGWV